MLIVFYMKEYHELQSTLYQDSQRLKIETNRLNYFCADRSDGTLLHGAVDCDFVGYVELLVAHGFDPSTKGRYGEKWTPISIAQEKNRMVILPLLQNTIQSTNKVSKEDEKKEEKEEEEEEMDIKSLSLRYDVMLLMYTISYFDINTQTTE